MKAVLLNDEVADLTTLPEKYRDKIKPKAINGKVCFVFPQGTHFDGDHALFLVSTGQASPLDDECRIACGLTDEQLASSQVGYVMDSLGIRDPKHRELYAGGVFTGYDAEGKMIPGPNWQAYQDAQKALENEDNV